MDESLINLITSLGVIPVLLVGAVIAYRKSTEQYIEHLKKTNAETITALRDVTSALKESTKALNRNSVIMLALSKKLGVGIIEEDE